MAYHNIAKIKNLFSLNNSNVEIIGSYSDKNLLYPNDIDFRSVNKNADVNKFVYDLRVLVKDIYLKRLGEVYFSDFKAGLDNTKPIKWNIFEIIQNRKEIEIVSGFKILTLEDAIKNYKGTIKLDLIINYKDTYKEVTCNYFLTLENGFSTSPLKTENVEEVYKREFINLQKDNPLKALKRLYLIVKDKKEFKKLSLEILTFLNSNVGFINFVNTNLIILNEVLKNNKIKLSFVKNNFQKIEKSISDPYIKKIIHNLSISKRKKILRKLPLLIIEVEKLFIKHQTLNFIEVISSDLKGT